jgi:hypothetical protein
MTDVFLERDFDSPVSVADLLSQFASARTCLDLHRISWKASLLSTDGQRSVCHFNATDAESLTIAMRQAGATVGSIWPGTVHLAAGDASAAQATANVIVSRRFEEPVTLDSVQAIEDAGAWCLEAHNVRFLRTFFSRNRMRMLCLYCAPDAESVRLAQRQAGMPVERVWPFTQAVPESGVSTST